MPAKIFPTLFLGAMLLVSVSAYAIEDDASGATANSIPMISGGIGDNEMDELKAVENQYNLKLIFTEGSGEYLSDVPVHVQDHKGHTVLDTVTKGPVLLLSLPQGSYKIKAGQQSVVREQNVTVKNTPHKSLHEYQFRFPAGTSDAMTN
jgi:hypothetical protein